MGAGRPRKFKTIEELQNALENYFNSCYQEFVERDKNGNPLYDENGKLMKYMVQTEPFTVTGLALALDTTRETLMDIQKLKSNYTQEYSDAITRAKLRCENYAEKQLFLAKSANGPQFALKNFGWVDRQEIDQTIHTPDVKIKFGKKPEEESKSEEK